MSAGLEQRFTHDAPPSSYRDAKAGVSSKVDTWDNLVVISHRFFMPQAMDHTRFGARKVSTV